MFAYCNNNPIANCDPTGMSSDDIEIGDDIGAIYYVNYDFLKNAGHASLLYKYDNQWYMVQLKSYDEFEGVIFEGLVAVSTLLSPISSTLFPLWTYAFEERECVGDIDQVKKRIKSNSDIIPLPGDFSAIHTDSTPTTPGEVTTKVRPYHLLAYNCNHYIKQQLKKCNEKEVVKNFGNNIIPSKTIKKLKEYYSAELK